MLQIGEDVDYLLIPREVRLAGGVWRVISKPATKEAEFRERLIQFLEEEGRTLEDVARIIEKSTPHPPQPPKKPKAPRVHRRVPQMVTPPPRLIVGTYDSSNASDSEFSDFETSRDKGDHGLGRARRVRKMPVSYLGSKFLGSDEESEDDEELVEAFLRRGEKPAAAPARRLVAVPVPSVEEDPPQLSKANRWREYASQVSWGKLKRRVKSWAPRSFQGMGETRQAASGMDSDRASGPGNGGQGENEGDTGGGWRVRTLPQRWQPKISWGSLRRHRRKEAASAAQGTEVLGDQRAEVPADEVAEAIGDQGAEIPVGLGAEAAADQRPEVAADQRAEAAADQGAAEQGAEAADNQGAAEQGAEAADDQGAEAADDQGAEAADDQGAEAADDQGAAEQGAEAADDQGPEAAADQVAEPAADQRAEASHSQGAQGATTGAKARKQVKTVRFQTPGRFSWFRKSRRAFWHTPRLPTLPKRVSRVGEARTLRVLRAEGRAEVEQGYQEDQL